MFPPFRSQQLSLQLDEPTSIEALLSRARVIDGLTVGQLAARLGVQLGGHPTRTKGRVGELVERALGASAGNLDLPDFPRLGVELKTIPIDTEGRVRESTFVCTVDLLRIATEEWESSRLWNKLRCVLWVPVEAASTGPLAQRHIGTARLWRPTSEESACLRHDWIDLVGRMVLDGPAAINGRQGHVLQIRPKAARGDVRTLAFAADGATTEALPRGFYLRARFTERVLWQLSAGTQP